MYEIYKDNPDSDYDLSKLVEGVWQKWSRTGNMDKNSYIHAINEFLEKIDKDSSTWPKITINND